MAAKKKKAKKGKKKPRRSHPGGGGARHGTVTIPRGMMLVPTGATHHRKKKGGRRTRRKNPGEGMHPHLKNAAAAVGFGTLAATVGMLGGLALSKANLKSKWANVAANVATGAVVGGGVGLVDRAAGTVLTHNYMVAAGQWLTAPDASAPSQTRALGTGQGVSPSMMARAPATHGLGEEIPDPESITPALPAPRGSLGSPLDHLGSPIDQLGGYSHLNGIIADHLGDGDDVGAFEHLSGIMADNLGEDLDGDEAIESVMADNLGDELEALDDELGFRG